MTKIRITLALAVCLAIPSIAGAQGLGAAPVIFTSGDWTVRKSKDTMTDKVSCTGLYLRRFDVQLARESFYITLRGRGGVKGFKIRLDDGVAGPIQIPSASDKAVSAVSVSGTAFQELLGARRLRAQVMTALDTFVTEDISLVGVPEAHAVITGPECTS